MSADVCPADLYGTTSAVLHRWRLICWTRTKILTIWYLIRYGRRELLNGRDLSDHPPCSRTEKARFTDFIEASAGNGNEALLSTVWFPERKPWALIHSATWSEFHTLRQYTKTYSFILSYLSIFHSLWVQNVHFVTQESIPTLSNLSLLLLRVCSALSYGSFAGSNPLPAPGYFRRSSLPARWSQHETINGMRRTPTDNTFAKNCEFLHWQSTLFSDILRNHITVSKIRANSSAECLVGTQETTRHIGKYCR